MSKTKIVVALGAVVLGISAFLATHATKKFAGAGSAYFKNSGGTIVTLYHGVSNGTVNLTVNSPGTNRTAFYRTNVSSSHIYTLYGTKSGLTLSNKLYL